MNKSHTYLPLNESTTKLDTLATRTLSKLKGRFFPTFGNETNKVTSLQKAILSSFAYSFTSISMVLVNKLILTTYQFDFPGVLLLLQCLTSLLLVFIANRLGFVEIDKVESNKLLQWFPVNIFFLAMLLSGFYSLQLLSVPMLLVFKNSNNVLVTCGDWFFFQQPISKLVLFSLFLLILATLLSAKEDLEFSFNGYVWTFLNMFASTAYVLYLRFAMKKTRLSQIGMVVHNNFLSVPLVILADYYTKNDLYKFFSQSEYLNYFHDPYFVILFLFNGVIGSFLSLASFLCVQTTSPTTFSMIGALNKIPLAIIGIQLFGARMTLMGVFYVLLSLASGGLYALAKVRHQQEEKEKLNKLETSILQQGQKISDDEESNSEKE